MAWVSGQTTPIEFSYPDWYVPDTPTDTYHVDGIQSLTESFHTSKCMNVTSIKSSSYHIDRDQVVPESAELDIEVEQAPSVNLMSSEDPEIPALVEPDVADTLTTFQNLATDTESDTDDEYVDSSDLLSQCILYTFILPRPPARFIGGRRYRLARRCVLYRRTRSFNKQLLSLIHI